MKKLILVLLIVPVVSFGQYSNYYNDNVNPYPYSDVNVSGAIDVNVNKNVNVNKTVRTIDYGALRQANATSQRNAIERLKIQNENERVALLAIAEDPVKAYDYGFDNKLRLTSKTKKMMGCSKKIKYFYHKVPHQSLFVRGGEVGYTYINESENGVITELIINPIMGEDVAKELGFIDEFENPEKALKFNDLNVGEENDLYGALRQANGDGDKSFLHKKDLNKTKVAGVDGFVGTLIFEDKYEKAITDKYLSVRYLGGLRHLQIVIVKFSSDRDEITFEELEGRRYYLKRFINRTILTINYY